VAPLLQSATTPMDGDAVVTVRGDIDTDTAPQLWQYLGYLILQGHHHIVLDLRGMVLIDSAGVELLARVSEWTRRRVGELVLRSASPCRTTGGYPSAVAAADPGHPGALGRGGPPGDQAGPSYLDTWRPSCRTGMSWLPICVPPTTPALPAPRPLRPASTASTGKPTAATSQLPGCSPGPGVRTGAIPS
jgi:anti-anti-sigma factor